MISIENISKKDGFMTEGPINQVILTISIPLMINNLIRTLYNLTDGLFVAQISEVDFAATAFVWPLNYVFISLGIGIGVGANALISQLLGARVYKKAEVYSSNAVMLSIILGFILSLIVYLGSASFVGWMGAEGELFTKSVIYLKISFIGLFFDFVFFSYQAILASQGKTKDITKISLISSITNIILDPILIFDTIPLVNLPGLGMGIAGAAWATVISKVVLLILALVIVRRESAIKVSLSLTRLDSKISRHIMKLSLPSALGNGGSALGFTMLNSLIQGYGTNTLAAYSMVNRITDLFMQPPNGIGNALTSIIGQNMGAEKYQRSRKIFIRSIQMITLTSFISFLIILIFRYQLLDIFIKDKANTELWSQAIEYIFFSAFIIFFMGFYSALIGFFQGVGRTEYAMFMNAGRLWLLRLPIIWFFGSFTSLGSTGVWIAMLLSNLLICVFGFLIYFTKDWKSVVEVK